MTTIALLASLAAFGYTVWYLILCVVAPWGRCRRCRGRRNHRTAIGTRRDCRRCDGTGRRVRIGRRLIEYVRAEYRAGQK
ncbi:hypothetical protein GA0070616_1441 [Micromonospora nigra]|uniref:Uncharacterized protein n=1 Tax=Micromonospora nigra TaxID=145857 RepID=A0A1C6RLT8_9ACTN|nr:hypothetical protein [Micromonospora nigra]SCL18138.1 hypothetical protein GA0070616_1441 [Micromonospora nigra]